MKTGLHPVQRITPAEVGRRLGVSLRKVLFWVYAGEIRAINLTQKLGGQPRFKIALEDVEDFERRRTFVPATPIPKRRKKPAGDVKEFF